MTCFETQVASWETAVDVAAGRNISSQSSSCDFHGYGSRIHLYFYRKLDLLTMSLSLFLISVVLV